MNTMTKISILFILIFFSACNSIKHLEKNEFLIKSSVIELDTTTEFKSRLNKYTLTKPNSKIFGIPLKLHIYNLAKQKPEDDFNRWLNNKPKRKERLVKWLSQKQLDKLRDSYINLNKGIQKSGEPPVKLDQDLVLDSEDKLKAWYWNHGFFEAKISHDIQRDSVNQTAKISYQIKPGQVTIIDSISQRIATPSIDSIINKTKQKSFIKLNEPFVTENFEKERNRITNYLRNHGYYNFEQDYISYYADTINTDHKINLELVIDNRNKRLTDTTVKIDFTAYKIAEVNVITDLKNNINTQRVQDSISFKNYNFYSFGKKVNVRPEVLSDLIFIEKDQLYSDNQNSKTYNRIYNTRIFKYPNIQYVVDPEDSTKLISNIFLTPKKRFSLNLQTNASQSNIQEFGIGFNGSLLARNLFKNAETLELSGRGNFGSSKDASQDDQFFDIFEYGFDLRLSFPRIIFPFNTDRFIKSDMSPFTSYSLGFSSQKNIGLDRRNFNLTYSINWKPKKNITNNIDLINVQFVNHLNIQNYFNVFNNSFQQLNTIAQTNSAQVSNELFSDSGDLLIPSGTNQFISLIESEQISLTAEELTDANAIIERQERLTENNLIVASNYTYNFSSKKSIYDNDFSQFRARIELSGNLLSLLAQPLNLNENQNGNYDLFNVQFSQYIKPELSFIKHWDFDDGKILATRAFAGIAIPLGNSNSIPFAKSFFAGGPNDNRGWRPYDLGPGKTNGINEFNEANFKLAFNAEFRFNLFGNLNSAFFVDAGNIWNALDNVNDPDARFDGLEDLKDLSIASGFGLRYDLSFFVLRVDLGFKTYNPGNVDQKWFKNYNFSNVIYNFGINYPF
ncbi:BamA/TamA family outer membrane protein [Psychroflexus sp. ALD_RP9]|nr:BamA/TamA family outer membrane protein [Psychroflexus sp. ALD_RP9]